ncbi:helix-turn-helix domain-containing protein [Salinarimonas sp. NSM]|uniref:helix-turn-helix domain-containing protein n=1 Tax=Salinarimonas sp. NSM TaxID=3458003 RepID=UPI00403589A9
MTVKPAPTHERVADPLEAAPSIEGRKPAPWQRTTNNVSRIRWLVQVATDPALSRLTYRVAVIICDHVNLAEGYAWPKVETIAGMLGVTRQGVQKAIGELKDGGHLVIDPSPGRGRSNRYFLRTKLRAVPGSTLDAASRS